MTEKIFNGEELLPISIKENFNINSLIKITIYNPEAINISSFSVSFLHEERSLKIIPLIRDKTSIFQNQEKVSLYFLPVSADSISIVRTTLVINFRYASELNIIHKEISVMPLKPDSFSSISDILHIVSQDINCKILTSNFTSFQLTGLPINTLFDHGAENRFTIGEMGSILIFYHSQMEESVIFGTQNSIDNFKTYFNNQYQPGYDQNMLFFRLGFLIACAKDYAVLNKETELKCAIMQINQLLSKLKINKSISEDKSRDSLMNELELLQNRIMITPEI